MQPSKPPVRVGFRINRDINLCGSKLLHHRLEVANAKIDHPLLLRPTEIICVVRKRGKDRRAGLLRPGLLAVISRHQADAEMLLVPLSHRRRILCAEEQATNSSYTLHANLRLTSRLTGGGPVGSKCKQNRTPAVQCSRLVRLPGTHDAPFALRNPTSRANASPRAMSTTSAPFLKIEATTSTQCPRSVT